MIGRSIEPINRRIFAATLLLILLASFLLKLRNLDHQAVKPLDEVFHAIVARNLLRHPLTPTLVDKPFLTYDRANWQANHVWLHKPPMALWQIAISYLLFGVNTWALRLPSAILSTLAAGLTALIGEELLNRTTGMIAAALQAFNPVILMLVHGYVFSDHVDISLLFWTELAIYFLARAARTNKLSDFICCGACQGLAFLSKTYPALLVTVVALANPATRKRLGIILLATAATVLPWILSTTIRFPSEFAIENLKILSHVNSNVEGWEAPWDRVVFDYLISVFHVFYPAVLAAIVLLIPFAWRKKHLGLTMILVWVLTAIAPNLIVVSKTMSATLIGWPAAWLCLGYFISQAIRGDARFAAAWAVAMTLALFTLHANSIPSQGWGTGGGFAAIMRAHLWVVWQVLGALLAAIIVRRFWSISIVLASTTMIALLFRFWPGDHPPGYAVVAWQVTQINKQRPAFAATGEFARHLPPSAAFLVIEESKLENKLLEFATDRSCYSVEPYQWPAYAAQLSAAGAMPYLVTGDTEPLPIVFIDSAEDRFVYDCTTLPH